MIRVLVVEDGHEYSDVLGRFLGSDFTLERAGDGPASLALLAEARHDLVFLDMRFDRAASLLGEDAAVRERFQGDASLIRQFLEEHQGTYILSAIRAAGVALPVVMSHDFDEEPRRFARLEALHRPLFYVRSSAGPNDIRAVLRHAALSSGTPGTSRAP